MVFGVVSSLLIGISALAWLLTRHRCGADVSILEWACRIVPLYCIFASFVIWATHSLLVALLVGTALLGGIAASCGWRPLPGKSSFLNVIAGMIGAFLSCATLCFLCASICLPLAMGLKFSSALHEPFVKGPWRGDEPTKEGSPSIASPTGATTSWTACGSVPTDANTMWIPQAKTLT